MRKKVLFMFLFAALFVFAADNGGAKYMAENLKWYGHSAFRWDVVGKIIYFDPWKITKTEKADLILVTHEHFDHFSKDDINKLSSDKTIIVSISTVLAEVSGNKREMKPGDKIDLDGIRVEAVPAYNIGKSFHTKESGKCGFIVTAGGVTVYHAGDTDFIPEMRGIKADIALLPVGGKYTMTADEAAEAAKIIMPKIAIPMHYGDVVGSEADAEKFRKELKGVVEVMIKKKEK